MKQIFAKLFDYPDKQVLITKSEDPEVKEAPYGVKFQTVFNEIEIEEEYAFETIEERNQFFDEINDAEYVNSIITPLCY